MTTTNRYGLKGEFRDEYYGRQRTKSEPPTGLVRLVYTKVDGVESLAYCERIGPAMLDWTLDPAVMDHVRDHMIEFEEMTEEEALKVLKRWRDERKRRA